MESDDDNCGCLTKRRKSSEKNLRSSTVNFTLAMTLPLGPVAHPEYFLGKRVLVTGATRGIGKNLVKNLHYLGAQVIACGRTDADLDTLCAEVSGIQPLIFDVTKWSTIERKLHSIGDVDFLVNCAGISYLGSILNATEEQFDEIFNTNIKGLFVITKVFAEQLIKRKAKGSIVSVSSQSSTSGIRRHGLFGASKAAVEAFTRCAAVEFAPHDIRINCVSPSVILSKTARHIWNKAKDSKGFVSKIPMKRFGEVHEAVQGILFLLSDKSSMITGCTMPVDGGFSAC
ncbi:L-xylulose reductase-like [Coccinella septempunctata]|uniref:L-xylulose reductase-like n=1 Tax=Coccinella septempunctata TaxID=41139 RepID=UPI001D08A068|nr:L-xylulose reductase-like [Coccinella septempunctata]